MASSIYVFHHHQLIRVWLACCLLLVAFMVAVGGYTRLSGSGLSITEWKPVHGTIPPIGATEWQEEYDAYMQSPQGRLVNRGMSMEEFKTIYWPEYWHRVLGRTIGLVFILPLLFFAITKSISRRFGWRLAAIFALGGLQGLMGWLMVASGLVDDPFVSHIRLAIHLSLAFLLFALILWALLDVIQPCNEKEARSVDRASPAVSAEALARMEARPMEFSAENFGGKIIYQLWFALLCLQIILGALVAGLKAGLVYNTWPMMNGMWLPPELWSDPKPWIQNEVLIQFLHRTLAVLVALGFFAWWARYRHALQDALYRPVVAVAVLIGLQFVLGVLTLLHQVPLNLALSHQMMGLLLFGSAVVLWYKLHHR